MPFILASASPRRAELLRQLGLEFITRSAEVEEKLDNSRPLPEQLRELALHKARAVAEYSGDGLVIGADTVVVLGDKVMGKPGSEAEAREMLGRLNGRMHLVMTAVALVDPADGRVMTGLEETRVRFSTLDPEQIEAYIKTGEPMDKAGAYGIQGRGAVLVESIEGCYFNVVGLPINLLSRMLKEMGHPVYASW